MINADSHLNDLMAELKDIRDEKDELTDNTKKVNARKEYVEGLIIERLQGEGVKKVSSDYGTASIKVEEYPNMDSFEVAIEDIVKHKAWDLLPKRVNAAAWRAARAEGHDLPGVSAFTKTTLNFRRK